MRLKVITLIKIIIVIMTILLIMSFFIIINFDKQNKELNNINQELIASIDLQEKAINELLQDNEDLNVDIEQLQNTNNELQNNNEILVIQNQELLAQIKEFENTSQIEEEVGITEETSIITASSDDFKSYMPYSAITNQSSKQWQLQQQAKTDADGIRCIDGIPMVAVGTGWGLSVGDMAVVICDNGNSFKVIIGDIKDNRHTDATNKITIFTNCQCEFIVETSKLNPQVKNAGNVAILSKYSGSVVSIEKAD